MKYIILIFALGCSANKKVHMHGVVDMIEDDWVIVEVTDANNASTWVKINRKNMRKAKEGDRIHLMVESSKINIDP